MNRTTTAPRSIGRQTWAAGRLPAPLQRRQRASYRTNADAASLAPDVIACLAARISIIRGCSRDDLERR